METYLHLADSGLVLANLSARLYDETGEVLPATGLSLAPLANGTSYELSGLPNVPDDIVGFTLTTEYPEGVYSAYRFGSATSQPAGVIIPIREVFADPLAELFVEVFRDGAEVGSLTVEQIAVDGEYLISGWGSPSSLGERWSVRWEYAGAVYAVEWTGTAPATTGTILQISAVQTPFDIGSDPNGRTQYSVNFDLSQILESPIEEIIGGILSAAPLSISATRILLGTAKVAPLLTQTHHDDPTTDGPYVRVMSSGGYSSTLARGEVANTHRRLDRPSVQLIIFSLDSSSAANTAMTIWKTLNGAKHISY